jgi:agmatine deiminase
MNKTYRLLSFFLCIPFISFAQKDAPEILPKWLHESEEHLIPSYRESLMQNLRNNEYETPPEFSVRTMAEWEEVESVMITWTSYPSILTEIVRHAQSECEVIIVCGDAGQVANTLNNAGVPLDNVTFLEEPFNSVWIRDYGPTTIYKDDVDERYLVNWIYNRPRPADNNVPFVIGQAKDIDVYSTIAAPYDIVNCGGNFHIDGMGTAFASMLVVNENGPGSSFNLTDKTEQEIDDVMHQFMGLDRYIKMPVLPYDGINHIDMHFLPLDEETFLVGEFPEGVADAPQIKANMEYLTENYLSPFGNPYKLVWIPMPSSPGGDGWGWNQTDPGDYADKGAYYRTYANALIVNKKVIVPTYREEYDTTGLRIFEENMPGYEIIGVNVEQMINAGGAIHCITKTIGASEPLLINHAKHQDTYDDENPYKLEAIIKHVSGINQATLYYTTDLSQGFNQEVTFSLVDAAENLWEAYIPAQEPQTVIHYYIDAKANSGKEQVRPMTAPDGYFQFEVLGEPSSVQSFDNSSFKNVYPNPASAITCIKLDSKHRSQGTISLVNVLTQQTEIIYRGEIPRGEKNFFINAQEYPSGVYFVVLETATQRETTKLIISH